MKKLAYAAIALFILVAPMVPWLCLFRSPATFCRVQDSVQYYTCAKMIFGKNPSDIFVREKFFQSEHDFFPALKQRVVPLWLPPFAVLLLSPIALVPANCLWVLWTLGLWVFLLGSVFVLGQTFALSQRQRFWLWTSFVVSAPCYESFHLGQLAPFMLLAFALGLLALKRERPIWSGICLSVLTLKPQLLLPFAALLLGARRFKVLFALAAFCSLLAVIAYLLFGIDGYANWFAGLRTLAENPYFTAHFTLRGQLERLSFLSPRFVYLSSTAVYFAVAALAFFCGRKWQKRPDWLEPGLVISMPLGMAASPYLSTSDLLLLAPALVAYYLTAGMPRPKAPLSYFLLGLASLFFLPLYAFVYYDFELKGAIISPLFWALIVLSAWLAQAALPED